MKKDIIEALLEAGRIDLADAMRSFCIAPTASEPRQESAGLFIRLPRPIAAQFPSRAPYDESPPHITVLYVGDVSDRTYREVLHVVQPVIEQTPRFQLSLASTPSYFPPSQHSGGKRVAKLAVIGPALHELRAQLWRTLAWSGVHFDDAWPRYQPHSTLGYIEPDTDWTGDVPRGTWTVDQVELWGATETIIPLGKQ